MWKDVRSGHPVGFTAPFFLNNPIPLLELNVDAVVFVSMDTRSLCMHGMELHSTGCVC